jgi:MFS family permease
MREQLRVVLTVAREGTLARIELAYLGFNMAEYATWIAILVYAYGLGGSGTAALVAMIQLVPSGIVAPFAAYAGDRFRRDRVLVAGYVWQGLALGATAAALFAGASAAVTIAFATFAAVSFTITRPIMAVILPSITHAPADLTAANAVTGLVENAAKFLGPLVCGLLLAGADAGTVFAVFATLSFGSALLVSRLPVKLERAAHDESGGGVRAILAGSFGGFGVLARERGVLLLVAIVSLATFVIGALDILFIAAAIDLLAAGEEWAGYLNAAFGLGGVVGSFATVALVGRRRMTPSLGLNSTLFGLPIAAVGAAPATATAPVLFAASGAGYGVFTVAAQTLLQRIAPEALLARVFGVVESLGMFALAIGSLAAGGLVAALGVGWALAVAGILVPATLALCWFQLSAMDRNARPVDTEALGLLRALPIFAPLSALTIERILADLTRLEVPAGHVLIRQGDPGDRFYVLAEGRVEILRNGVVVSERGAGDHFGEIALLRDVPRTATVRALTPLRVVAIEREQFLEAVTGHAQSHAHANAAAAKHSHADEQREAAQDVGA